MKRTRKETIAIFNKELSNIETLYKSNCVNWKGTTKDTNELCSEIIANELIEGIKAFNNISIVTRVKTYCRENHHNMEINDTNRYEEIFAKRIKGLELDGLGLIMDFQVPLKNKRSDNGGKIDLISFNKETRILYLIELKYGNNNETLLRAILESYTYFKIVDEKKLKKDCFNSQDINIKPAVLVIPDCNAYKELKEIKNGQRPKLKELTNDLGVSCFAGKFEATIRNIDMKQLL